MIGHIRINEKKYPIYEGTNTLGRNTKARVNIPHASISQHHAIIMAIDKDNIYISDINSSNGTIINTVKLSPFRLYKLKSSDKLEIGSLAGEFHLIDENEVEREIALCSELYASFSENFYTQNTQIVENRAPQTSDHTYVSNDRDIHDLETQIFPPPTENIHELATQLICYDEVENIHEMATQVEITENDLETTNIHEMATQILDPPIEQLHLEDSSHSIDFLNNYNESVMFQSRLVEESAPNPPPVTKETVISTNSSQTNGTSRIPAEDDDDTTDDELFRPKPDPSRINPNRIDSGSTGSSIQPEISDNAQIEDNQSCSIAAMNPKAESTCKNVICLDSSDSDATDDESQKTNTDKKQQPVTKETTSSTNRAKINGNSIKTPTEDDDGDTTNDELFRPKPDPSRINPNRIDSSSTGSSTQPETSNNAQIEDNQSCSIAVMNPKAESTRRSVRFLDSTDSDATDDESKKENADKKQQTVTKETNSAKINGNSIKTATEDDDGDSTNDELFRPKPDPSRINPNRIDSSSTGSSIQPEISDNAQIEDNQSCLITAMNPKMESPRRTVRYLDSTDSDATTDDESPKETVHKKQTKIKPIESDATDDELIVPNCSTSKNVRILDSPPLTNVDNSQKPNKEDKVEDNASIDSDDEILRVSIKSYANKSWNIESDTSFERTSSPKKTIIEDSDDDADVEEKLVNNKVADVDESILIPATQDVCSTASRDGASTYQSKLTVLDDSVFVAATQDVSVKHNNSTHAVKEFEETLFGDESSNSIRLNLGESVLSDDESSPVNIDIDSNKNDDVFLLPTQAIGGNVLEMEREELEADVFMQATQKISEECSNKKANDDGNIYAAATQKLSTEPNGDEPYMARTEKFDDFVVPTVPKEVISEENDIYLQATQKVTGDQDCDREENDTDRDDIYLQATQLIKDDSLDKEAIGEENQSCTDDVYNQATQYCGEEATQEIINISRCSNPGVLHETIGSRPENPLCSVLEDSQNEIHALTLELNEEGTREREESEKEENAEGSEIEIEKESESPPSKRQRKQKLVVRVEKIGGELEESPIGESLIGETNETDVNVEESGQSSRTPRRSNRTRNEKVNENKELANDESKIERALDEEAGNRRKSYIKLQNKESNSVSQNSVDQNDTLSEVANITTTNDEETSPSSSSTRKSSRNKTNNSNSLVKGKEVQSSIEEASSSTQIANDVEKVVGTTRSSRSQDKNNGMLPVSSMQEASKKESTSTPIVDTRKTRTQIKVENSLVEEVQSSLEETTSNTQSANNASSIKVVGTKRTNRRLKSEDKNNEILPGSSAQQLNQVESTSENVDDTRKTRTQMKVETSLVEVHASLEEASSSTQAANNSTRNSSSIKVVGTTRRGRRLKSQDKNNEILPVSSVQEVNKKESTSEPIIDTRKTRNKIKAQNVSNKNNDSTDVSCNTGSTPDKSINTRTLVNNKKKAKETETTEVKVNKPKRKDVIGAAGDSPEKEAESVATRRGRVKASVAVAKTSTRDKSESSTVRTRAKRNNTVVETVPPIIPIKRSKRLSSASSAASDVEKEKTAAAVEVQTSTVGTRATRRKNSAAGVEASAASDVEKEKTAAVVEIQKITVGKRATRRKNSDASVEAVASVAKKKRGNKTVEENVLPRSRTLSTPDDLPASQSSTISSASSTLRSGRRLPKPKVVFTMFNDPQLESTIRQMGGKLVDSVDSCTVLVTESVKRSCKLLTAIGQGKPICSADWIRQSKSAKEFLDPWEHIIVDKEAEKKWKFSIQESLKRSKENKLLQGYTFQLITSNLADNEIEILRYSIKACGGKIVTKLPVRAVENCYIIATKENKTAYSTIIKKNPNAKAIVAEAIFDGVLRQEIQFDKHYLK